MNIEISLTLIIAILLKTLMMNRQTHHNNKFQNKFIKINRNKLKVFNESLD